MDLIKNLKWFLNTSATLLLIWWILSGKMDALHFGTGIVGALAITLSFYPSRRKDGFPMFKFLAFIPWHLTQVVISNLRVARLALLKGNNFETSFVRAKPEMSDVRGLALLGCGITLTPGTLTVDISKDSMLIHALDKASAEDIKKGVMTKRVKGVFGEGG
jgi:multicomponent Na+:H+ antiporter subunit E